MPLDQVSGLSETLTKKKAEMAGMENQERRFKKKYIKKTKSFIKTRPQRGPPPGLY